MSRLIAALAMVAAAVAASASAASGPPPSTVKATVSGKTVTITNGSASSYKSFEINSTDSPKITGANDKTCKAGSGPWSSNGVKHVDYWVDCKRALAPHKSVKVTITTSGSGPVKVWVQVPGAHGVTNYPIGTGTV